MTNHTIIHETIVRDIVDLINTARNTDFIDLKNDVSIKSISHASDAMTLVVPIPTSTAVSVSSASMVAKSIERKYATMLQMVFSAININNSDNGIDYLRRFHTNLKMDDKLSLDSYMDFMASLPLDESINPIEYRNELKSVMEDLKYHTSYLVKEAFNPVSLSDYRLVNTYGREKIIHKNKKITTSIYEVDLSDDLDFRREKNYNDAIKNQLIATDVKKANEIVPTMMVVKFVNMVDGVEKVESSMVIGVKAKIYPINSEDMMERLYSKNQDRNGFLKLIRATTREISFFKDFIFAIDKAKIDALSSSRRGSSSKIWKILERRAVKSRLRRALMQPNDASAISVICISQEEVEYLKKNYNVHVDNARVIRPIMESYNLMGVVIVDELNEVLIANKLIQASREDKDMHRVECELGCCHEIDSNKFMGYVVVDTVSYNYVFNKNYNNGNGFASILNTKVYLNNPAAKFKVCKDKRITDAINKLIDKHHDNVSAFKNENAVDLLSMIGYDATTTNSVDNTTVNTATNITGAQLFEDETVVTITNNATAEQTTTATKDAEATVTTQEELDEILAYGFDEEF